MECRSDIGYDLGKYEKVKAEIRDIKDAIKKKRMPQASRGRTTSRVVRRVGHSGLPEH